MFLLFLVPYLWIPLGGFILSAAVPKPWTLTLPVLAEVVFWYGLSRTWWGFGFGETTEIIAILTTSLGLVAAGAGLMTGTLLRRFTRSRRPPSD